MKKRIAFTLSALILFLAVFGAASCEEAGHIIRFSREAEAGDKIIRLDLAEGYTAQQANVFSGEEAIATAAEIEDSMITLTLTRGLKAGEKLLIIVNVASEGGESIPVRLETAVRSPFGSKLAALAARADQSWPVWADEWCGLFLQNKVYLPLLWKEIPFVLWPDEAPEIQVRESDGKAQIYLQNEDLAGWTVCLGKGIPIVYSSCVYDETFDSWIGEGEFDSVFLIREARENHPEISIEYSRDNHFLPSYPILAWEGEKDGVPIGMNCYGWGTARTFQGGMYAIASEECAFYAEYDVNGVLTNYQDAYTECVYDVSDHLVSGEEPENYQNPVFH